MVSASQVFSSSFFKRFNFSWFCSPIRSVICYFLLFIIYIIHFSMTIFIPKSSRHIFLNCMRISNSFSFLTNNSTPFIKFWWLIFLVIYEVCIHQCISEVWDSVVPSLSPILMLIAQLLGRFLSGFSPQLSFFFSSCLFNSSVFHGFLDKHLDFNGYLVHFETLCYSYRMSLWK